MTRLNLKSRTLKMIFFFVKTDDLETKEKKAQLENKSYYYNKKINLIL
jgi:hypothetical protein